jgi:uncharacterized protein YgbK (DUF1537 family)
VIFMDVAANNLLVAFYGDDFTGSTDAMESLTLAGVRTVLFTAPPNAGQLARHPGVRAIGVAGLTRSMTPDAIEAELRPALAKLKSLGAPFVQYKVCSTFDSSPRIGSIGRAIDVGRDVFADAPFVPLVVGAPALGRYCVFGNLFARFGRDGEAFRLDRHPSMSRHPTTPADESDLRYHLRRQTNARIALFDILSVAMPESTARAALDALLSEGWEVVLFDALHPEHLARIGTLIGAHAGRQRPLFAVGSSGMTSAIGAHLSATGATSPLVAFSDPGPAKPLLVVSGSCSPVTRDQIGWATGNGFAEVVLDAAALSNESLGESVVGRAADAAASRLARGGHVIVHTGPSEIASLRARRLGAALAVVIREAVARAGLRRVLIAGGDTSGYVARALGVESMEMIAPLVPGAPLCRARAADGSPADGLELNFKGGQVGGPDYFGMVADGRGLR